MKVESDLAFVATDVRSRAAEQFHQVEIVLKPRKGQREILGEGHTFGITFL